MNAGWEQKAVSYIDSQQKTDGSFTTALSRNQESFSTHAHISTVFTISLLLRMLNGIAGTEKITNAAAAYTLAQQHASGSWNYWHNGTPEARLIPLPDDLDDTACAVIALQKHGSLHVDGSLQARLAKLLIAVETAPGGPYKTWLTPKQTKKWDDIDPAVNANIGYMLHLQGVSLRPLESYFDTVLTNEQLDSPYYVGVIPGLYFLSEWYRGNAYPRLQQCIKRALDTNTTNPILLSLALLAAKNCNLSSSVILAASQKLMQLRTDNHWTAAAFYIHRIDRAQTEYAGSAALTTACALRALTNIDVAIPRVAPRTTTATRPRAVSQKAVSHIHDIALRATYTEYLQETIRSDTAQIISNPAGQIAHAFGLTVPKNTRTHLNKGSLNGWMAYTLYDGFFDEEGRPADLAVASVALRESLTHFRAALPQYTPYQRLIDETFSIIDAANLWEAQHARKKINMHQLSTTRLPDYGDLSQLAHKSWGHTLAASGALLAANQSRKTINHVHEYFHHYLIARQLNDDAHDWQLDLTRGHISAVLVVLLKAYGKTQLHIQNEIRELSQLYWNETVVEVSAAIRYHCELAVAALEKSGCVRPRNFLAALEPLMHAATETESKQHHAKAFIETFSVHTRQDK